MRTCPPEHALYEAVVEQGAALVGVGDATSIRFLSPSVGAALGSDRLRLPSPRSAADDLVHVEDRERLAQVFQRSTTTGEAVATQLRLQHADGRFLTVDCVVRDLHDDERVGGYLVQAWDVTAREAAFQRAAMYDVLTGLPNRVLFADRLARALRAQQRHSRRVGVVFVDLDGFKAINDEHGHQVGDAVLQEVGRRLAEAVRPGDTVARLGGDEFVVLCEELADAAAGRDVALRMAQALEPAVVVDGTSVHVGASMGVALADDPLVSPDRLVSQADLDMYDIKRRSRRQRATAGR